MWLLSKSGQNIIKESRMEEIDPESFDRLIMDNIKINPDKIDKFKQVYPDHVERFLKENPEYSDEYTIKCPTCGCPKTRRISGTEKVASAVALGFFSNKRKQQFECLNPRCRYRW